MQNETLYYPLLGSRRDLGFVRLSGLGLGNSFFTYFHTHILSRKHGGRVIFPAWRSIKTGPILRGDARNRFYSGLFQPTPDEVTGFAKYAALARVGSKTNVIHVDRSTSAPIDGALNLVSCRRFVFDGLIEHRSEIRSRFLEILKEPVSEPPRWGQSDYIACHVRMGDFAAPASLAELNSGAPNKRIPLSWYAGVLRRLKNEYPNKPLLIVSDGHAKELRDLLTIGARLHPTRSDIGDLLALSSASILVGSNSTFSQWAAFLGDMPSVWHVRSEGTESICSNQRRIAYIPVGSEDLSNPIF
ncbi:hypothetical protein ABIB90_004574 [Bradyrhizobium sp. JR4.1]|uniref:hypothetical protein n=1 Tax=Bradyrhizobium sp. JR4.1 TaxID=3156372 RepID=UPI003397FFDA